MARAAKQREERKARKEQAAANRARFGRSGAEKKAAREDKKKAERLLEGKRIERPSASPNSPSESPDESS